MTNQESPKRRKRWTADRLGRRRQRPAERYAKLGRGLRLQSRALRAGTARAPSDRGPSRSAGATACRDTGEVDSKTPAPIALRHANTARKPTLLYFGLVALISFAAASPVHAQFSLFGASRIENFVAPVYLEFGEEPVAMLRIKSVSTEYQRKGFFRIGLLPMLVLTEIAIEVRDMARFGDALSGVQQRIEPRAAGRCVEFRHLT